MAENPLSKLKIAIVYDHLNTQYGGAELVLKNLLAAFPQADFFTSIYNPQKVHWLKIKVQTTWLNNFYFLRCHHRLAGLLMPLAFESLDLSAYQIVISVSGGSAKGIITQAQQLHLCYLLTPTRYLFSHQQDYWQKPIFKLPIIKFLAKGAKKYLTAWDKVAAFRPDQLIAISNKIAQRSQQYYHRGCTKIIYPPVKISTSQPATPVEQDFYLVIARLVSYKKIDLAIKACIKFKKNLFIIGTGPHQSVLQKLSKNQHNIKFLGNLNSKEKNAYLASCKALILPGIEDFGISALEANSFGKPVILNQESGASEIIKNKINGIHLKQQNLPAYQQAFNQIETQNWDKKILINNAQLYQEQSFQTNFKQSVLNFYQDFIKHDIV